MQISDAILSDDIHNNKKKINKKGSLFPPIPLRLRLLRRYEQQVCISGGAGQGAGKGGGVCDDQHVSPRHHVYTQHVSPRHSVYTQHARACVCARTHTSEYIMLRADEACLTGMHAVANATAAAAAAAAVNTTTVPMPCHNYPIYYYCIPVLRYYCY